MKRTLALILAIVMTMALVACGGNPSTSGSSGNTSGGPTDVGDINQEQQGTIDETKTYKKSLEIALITAITQIDPMFATGNGVDMAYKMMYNQLIAYNWDTQEAEPELAESWIVENAASYVFNLRKGVKFSNGEEFTADDVVFTFVDRPAAVTGTTGTVVWENIEEIEVINDYSVRFKLVKPDADFLYRLYLAYYAVLNREACEADAEKGHLVGTGGWILDSWATNDHVTLVRFDDSWVWEENGMNPTEKVVLRHFAEETAEAIALQNAEIAAGSVLDDSDLPPLSADPNVHVYTFNAQTLMYMFFNMNNGVFADNVKLRQAVAYALNYDDIIELGTSGLGQRAYSMWGKNQYGLFEDFDEQYENNQEKAKALLAEAGYPNGLEIHMIESDLELATMYKEQLEDVGFTVNLEIADSVGKNAAVKSGDFDLMSYSISLQAIGDRFHFVCNPESSTNRAKYVNPEMLAKFDTALAESDDATRKQLYKEIQIELHEQIPYLPLYYKVGHVGWYDGVSGIKWEPDQKADFTHIRWEEK